MNLLDVVYVGVAGATSPWWVRKARGGWRQRFAMDVPEMPTKRGGVPRILLHAVSVGEAAALRSLVPLLLDGGAEVVVSCSPMRWGALSGSCGQTSFGHVLVGACRRR